jgi:hypothetical protein
MKVDPLPEPLRELIRGPLSPVSREGVLSGRSLEVTKTELLDDHIRSIGLF